MSYQALPVGRDIPNDVNVIIEIPMNSPAVKYEVDKTTGAMFVDRFMTTAMHYPCNYGYIPHTLSADGDPVDVAAFGANHASLTRQLYPLLQQELRGLMLRLGLERIQLPFDLPARVEDTGEAAVEVSGSVH
mgnify:CR=1 FL=1